MTQVLAIVAAVLAISLLIVIHEAGHFLAARRFGMRVERFSVGFGPVLLSFRRGETEFAISALPLGGYVKIAGMGPGEAADATDRALFANQAAWRRFLVILAGPAMNYVAAILIAWGLLATVGLRVPDPGTSLGKATPGKPAAAAGLRPGDRVTAVAGEPVRTWEEFVAAVQRHPGEPIVLDVVRGEGAAAAPLAIPITPNDDRGRGVVGVRRGAIPVRSGGPGLALVDGVQRTNANAAGQLAGFGALFSKGKASMDAAVGPAGIIEQMVEAASDGLGAFFGFVWTISVVLAILNLLPIPALDGGRLVFLAYEIVSRRRVNEKVEGYVHFAGFVLLVGLILAVTVFGDLPRMLRR